MNIEQMTEFLEIAWDDGGILAQIRAGRFDENEAEKFLHVFKEPLIKSGSPFASN